MNYKQYVAAIQKLAEDAGETTPGKPYCNSMAWLDSFRCELTPQEAWAEEVAADRME